MNPQRARIVLTPEQVIEHGIGEDRTPAYIAESLDLADDVGVERLVYDPVRDVTMVIVTGDRFAPVPPGVEAPIVDLVDLRPKAEA